MRQATESLALYRDFENQRACLVDQGQSAGSLAASRFRPQEQVIDISTIIEFALSVDALAINRAFANWVSYRSPDPVVRFETPPGEQMQVDWVEFRKGADPLYAFCATLGISRLSHVEFVTDMKVTTSTGCHARAFEAFGGVPRIGLHDSMKIVVIERDARGEGAYRYHAGFPDYARRCGFTIKLRRPYRALTKGTVERFNGYLRCSFYVPLVAQLKQAALVLDAPMGNAHGLGVAQTDCQRALTRVDG